MLNLNNATLSGRIGKDPEITRFPDGGMIAKFSLATTESWKDKATNEWKEQTQWHNIVTKNKTAELAERLIKKGQGVYIEGKIVYRSWEDTNGAKRTSTEIVAETFKIFAKAKDQSDAVVEPTNDFPSDEPDWLK